MDNSNVEVAAGGGATGSSRWNPTKEQISMLENLYGQGIRTPSAEQIQQITGRLKAYGHIEGKNVFYWFQNHKARQRQKQKQEDMVYINRYIHNPPCPNGSFFLFLFLFKFRVLNDLCLSSNCCFVPHIDHASDLSGFSRQRKGPKFIYLSNIW